MTYERDQSHKAARFYGAELLNQAPTEFQKRLRNALRHVHDPGLQVLLTMEESKRVPLEKGIRDVFVEVKGEEYRESFHDTVGGIYHVILIGDGAREKVRMIRLALGSSSEEAEIINDGIALQRNYPLAYRK